MMKKAAQCSVFAVLLFMASVSFAQSAAIQVGLNNLFSTQNPDGSWGSDSSETEILPCTVAVLQTLQLLNQTNTESYSKALLWLQGQGLDFTEYLSERIRVLSVAGNDVYLLIS